MKMKQKYREDDFVYDFNNVKIAANNSESSLLIYNGRHIVWDKRDLTNDTIILTKELSDKITNLIKDELAERNHLIPNTTFEDITLSVSGSSPLTKGKLKLRINNGD